jgi:penicillin G amidase
MATRRWPRRAGITLGVLVLVVVLVAALTVVWSVRRAWPQVDGEVAVAGLDAPVEVLRDALGVPHITASTTADLYRAQGWVHAQDRFWQMDAWRHITAGRTAELFGSGGLDTDRFLRTLGWHRIAEQEYAQASSAGRAALDAYAEGVNAYLDSRPHRALGLEYSVLGLTNRGYQPEPWTPVHSLAFAKLMAWDLSANLLGEIERAVLDAQLGPERSAELFPDHPDWAPTITGDTGGDAAGGTGTDIGSNNWVVGGSLTASGASLLANDTHLSIGMPSIWYQIGLHCDGCDGSAVGFSFPSAPGAVIGHNGEIAWGVTNFGSDTQDLYVERLNPDDEEQYEVDGDWADMTVRTETLRVAGGPDETLEVRETRNGPVISDVYGALDDYDPSTHLDVDGPYAVAFRWAALEPSTILEAVLDLNRATDWHTFRAALASWDVAGQNFVYADAGGEIGYQVTGRVPIRGQGDGSVPVPGWDSAYQWTGWVPYDELPRLHEPERGWIVTANNPPAGGDYPHLLGTSFDAGYRAARIEALVADGGTALTIEDMQSWHMDNHNGSADWLVPALLDIPVEDPTGQVQDLLRGWDGRMDADSAGAAAFAATWRHLLARLFHDVLPERYHPHGSARWMEVVRRLLDDPGNPWWRGDRDAVLADAMANAHAELAERLGAEPDAWAWGDLHTAEFRNATLGESGIDLVERLFNRGPYPVGGGSAIVNATSWHAARGYEVVAVPSQRLVVDFADLDATIAIHTTGQSGHPYHRHYTSMIDRWATGEQHPLPWTPAAVDAAAVHRLTLTPSSG